VFCEFLRLAPDFFDPRYLRNPRLIILEKQTFVDQSPKLSEQALPPRPSWEEQA